MSKRSYKVRSIVFDFPFECCVLQSSTKSILVHSTPNNMTAALKKIKDGNRCLMERNNKQIYILSNNSRIFPKSKL